MTTPDTENARKLVASVRAAYDASTQGIWSVCGIGYNVPIRSNSGQIVSDFITEKILRGDDAKFIALAHNALPVILAHLASVERDLSDLRTREAALTEENEKMRKALLELIRDEEANEE